MGYTEMGRPIRIQDRQLLFRSTKIMNSLRLALTLVFLGSISQLLAGTEMDLKTSPSPTDETKTLPKSSITRRPTRARATIKNIAEYSERATRSTTTSVTPIVF